MKVLDVMWFTGAHGCVGIVKVETQYDGIKYFIGPARGFDEDLDKQEILDWGARFPEAAGAMLFGE